MCIRDRCYIEKDDSYLMLHRVSKKNDENKDKWIGIGGHFEEGESPEDCLLREAKEETGLTLTSWKFRGIVTFVSDVWGTEYMCLYTADGYTCLLYTSRKAGRRQLFSRSSHVTEGSLLTVPYFQNLLGFPGLCRP